MIKNLKIVGYRGFDQVQELNFAKPNGTVGSGLTFIVGENNSG